MRIYLDNCCFNRPFDNQDQIRIRLDTEAKLSIQEQVYNEQLELVWSYILDFENQANPHDERRESISEWANIASILVEPSDELNSLAEPILETGLRPKDALHLASALISECSHFLTTDLGILKKSKEVVGIQIMNPIDFIIQQEDS